MRPIQTCMATSVAQHQRKLQHIEMITNGISWTLQIHKAFTMRLLLYITLKALKGGPNRMSPDAGTNVGQYELDQSTLHAELCTMLVLTSLHKRDEQASLSPRCG